MTATTYVTELARPDDEIEHVLALPGGRELVIRAGLNALGAVVVYLDTADGDESWEPTADLLRVNVNDGPVFNYPDAVNWYGAELGHPAPVITYADADSADR